MTAGIARLITSAQLAELGHYAEHFLQLPIDAEWLTAVAALTQERHGTLRTLAQRFARLYLSDFDANALIGMYRMQLLPAGAWLRLFGGRPGGRLLDVGAGAGDVTAPLATCFDEVETTEVSRGMVKRLRRRGFRCHELDLGLSAPDGPAYDAVSLLNVLDRCASPRALLRNCQRALKPGGLLVVALTLPYRPFYFAGPTTPEPLERLECGDGDDSNWKSGARRLLERELLPLGLSLVRFARAPYLSAGDSKQALYELDCVVALLRNGEISAPLAPSPAKD